MNNRVKKDLLKFQEVAISNDEIPKRAIYDLLNAYRIKFHLDMIFICEALVGTTGYRMSYRVAGNQAVDSLKKEIYMTKKEYEESVRVYSESLVSEDMTFISHSMSSLRCIHYGFIRDNYNDGAVFFVSSNKDRIWTDEEREALCMLGRIMKPIIHEHRIEQINFKRQAHLERALMSAEKANAAKSTFLLNMSHDIRTPMNAILGFTKVAEENIDEKDIVKASLEKIDMSGQHLLRLINDILDMSRIERGKVNIDEEPTDIKELLNTYRIVFNEQLISKKLTYNTKFKDVEDSMVYLDKLRMNQICINLISNAVKYTRDGGRIDITLTQLPINRKGMASFELKVSDTGIGMSKAFMKNLFEPFEREYTSTVSGQSGTGLGMSIVKKLLGLMGGKIKVESEIGKGTTFKVYLDFKKCTDVSSTRVDNYQDINCTGLTALIVEDNPLNMELASMLLTNKGFNVETASDGSIAIEYLKNHPEAQIDIVFMDIQMPYLNGYETAVAIRNNENPRFRELPIIAMTANAFEEDKKRVFDSGMNGFVTKPIDVDKLYATIGDVLKNR